jgi:hypothetical protein
LIEPVLAGELSLGAAVSSSGMDKQDWDVGELLGVLQVLRRRCPAGEPRYVGRSVVGTGGRSNLAVMSLRGPIAWHCHMINGHQPQSSGRLLMACMWIFSEF